MDKKELAAELCNRINALRLRANGTVRATPETHYNRAYAKLSHMGLPYDAMEALTPLLVEFRATVCVTSFGGNTLYVCCD